MVCQTLAITACLQGNRQQQMGYICDVFRVLFAKVNFLFVNDLLKSCVFNITSFWSFLLRLLSTSYVVLGITLSFRFLLILLWLFFFEETTFGCDDISSELRAFQDDYWDIVFFSLDHVFNAVFVIAYHYHDHFAHIAIAIPCSSLCNSFSDFNF